MEKGPEREGRDEQDGPLGTAVLAEEREPQAFNVPGQCSIRRVTVRPPADSHSLAATKGVVFLVWP